MGDDSSHEPGSDLAGLRKTLYFLSLPMVTFKIVSSEDV